MAKLAAVFLPVPLVAAAVFATTIVLGRRVAVAFAGAAVAAVVVVGLVALPPAAVTIPPS